MVVDANGRVAFRSDVSSPAALHAVEGKQVGGRRSAALEFVELHDRQSVAATGVVLGPFGGAHRSTQCETADAAHSVDANSHVDPLEVEKG
jgi:hypothetical protein